VPQSLEDLVTFDVIPLVRTALKETAELTGAVQLLTERVEDLTTELVEGEVKELRRLAAAALLARQAAQEGDRP
jgi:hypothetical protein